MADRLGHTRQLSLVPRDECDFSMLLANILSIRVAAVSDIRVGKVILGMKPTDTMSIFIMYSAILIGNCIFSELTASIMNKHYSTDFSSTT